MSCICLSFFLKVDQLYDDDGNDTDFNGSDFDLDNDTNGSYGARAPTSLSVQQLKSKELNLKLLG
eukprot:811378-Amphidinium_carterae.1